MINKIIKVEENSKERIDIFLLGYLELNRSQVKRYLKSGNILVNEKIVKSGYFPQKKDEIKVSYEDEYILEPKKIDFKVLYEDEYLAIISKPQNLVVHPGAGNLDNTLVNGILYRFNELATNTDEFRPGIVHRLDKDTSGLMIIAKKDIAFTKLIEMFKNSEIKKEYIAIVKGIIQEDGQIDKAISRDTKNRTRMSVSDFNGKKALTNFFVKESFKKHTYLNINIVTGRTHQIRVHMKYIGHPVLGDLVYGNKNKYGIDKQMLHSYKLSFHHPISGEYIEIKDDIPERFVNFLKRDDI